MVNKIEYRCGNALQLEVKISTFVFGLQSATQKIVAHETEKLNDKRRSFEHVTQTARKENEACRARLTKPAVSRKTFYASFCPEYDNKDHAFVIYGKIMAMGIMAGKSEWCRHHYFLDVSEIIDLIALDGLTNRCETKDAWYPTILFVINVLLTKNTRRIINCSLNAGTKLLLALKA